jgi:hypothetical protein
MELMVLDVLLVLAGVGIGWTLARIPPRPVDDDPPAEYDAVPAVRQPTGTVTVPPAATTSTTRIADEDPWWVPADEGRIVE